MAIPGWVVPLAAVLVLSGTHLLAYNHGVDTERTRQQLATSGNSVDALAEARQVETQHAETTNEAVADAQTDLSAIPDLRPELDRVRDQNAELRRKLSGTADAAQRGEAATRAAMVLSELLDRATARNAELARLYDDALIRGNLCVSISDNWRRLNAPQQAK